MRRALAFSVAIAASWTLSSYDIDAQPYGATTQSGTAAAGVAPISVGAQPNTAPLALPDPIYWKQQLFLIPYKWQSAVEPSSARAVYLFVSRDRGASWQKISDAKPEVKAFNYRAEGDGEYWFAVRTADARGQLWPAGPYQPELRVIVDTTIPRIDELRARPTETGAIDIECRATDVNLNSGSLRIEAQLSASAPWQLVPLQVAGSPTTVSELAAASSALPAPSSPLHAVYQPPAGIRPLAIRATISDRAGNSAVYQTPVDTTPLMTGPLLSQPAMSAPIASPVTSPPVAAANPAAPPPTSAAPTGGWAGSSGSAAPPVALPATQPWPAGATARGPLQLWTNGAGRADDGMTAYGTPAFTGAGLTSNVGSVPVTFGSAATPSNASPAQAAPSAASAASSNDNRVPAHFAGAVRTDSASANSATASAVNLAAPSAGPQFAQLEPFRQAAAPVSATGQQSSSAISGPSLVPIGQSNQLSQPQQLTNSPITPVGGNAPPTHRPGTPPKLVGSRTFALEYDLDDNSQAGVTRVELWGTRDGGQTWNRYTVDDDSRSPLVVTVDDEGLYGFKILVQSATGAAITPPQPGNEPELWVSVDLKRPIIELTSIARGEGNLADHLVLRWRVQDNNLEPRPISLFFSSRPTGPWSVIAANLENTGEYAWRVERYVPTRIYIRAEARDEAGNLAAFQTREPVVFSAIQADGRLKATMPNQPAATARVAPAR